MTQEKDYLDLADRVEASAEEMAVSAREHPDVHRDILVSAIHLARDRGGQTIPVSSYDITRAQDQATDYSDENAKLRARITELEMALHASRVGDRRGGE